MPDEFRGYVDGADGNLLSGWASAGPDGCSIDLYIDGVFVLRQRSDLYREDLRGVVSADGRRAFVIPVPAVYCDGAPKLVEIVYAGTRIALSGGCGPFRFEQHPLAVRVKAAPGLQQRALELFSLLRPRDVRGGRLIRLGRPNDGGYVMLDQDLSRSVGYSIGVNDDASWDLDMADRGARIFQYDHTIDAPPCKHPNLRWERIGVAGSADHGRSLMTLPELIARNGHERADNLILKMDVEGYEWDVLNGIGTPDLLKFSQILIELHGLDRLDETDYFARIRSALRNVGASHQLIHVHANNCGGLTIMSGVPVPSAVEVTYVRRRGHDFEECRKIFPTEIDMPCSPAIADPHLGFMGLYPEPE